MTSFGRCLDNAARPTSTVSGSTILTPGAGGRTLSGSGLWPAESRASSSESSRTLPEVPASEVWEGRGVVGDMLLKKEKGKEEFKPNYLQQKYTKEKDEEGDRSYPYTTAGLRWGGR